MLWVFYTLPLFTPQNKLDISKQLIWLLYIIYIKCDKVCIFRFLEIDYLLKEICCLSNTICSSLIQVFHNRHILVNVILGPCILRNLNIQLVLIFVFYLPWAWCFFLNHLLLFMFLFTCVVVWVQVWTHILSCVYVGPSSTLLCFGSAADQLRKRRLLLRKRGWYTRRYIGKIRW